MEKSKKKIVVIGGGTGTFTVLSGLRKYANKLDISVIVSMMDDGGSNKVIRDEFGLLPTSDIRQCVVALASGQSNEILRKLFTYRYSSGTGITGMTFGNLFMAALTDIFSSQKKAIEETCNILGVVGSIVPVTYDNVRLLARYENGKQIFGEHGIDEPDEKQGKFRIVDLEVVPRANVNEDALRVIRQADLIILGPGDLYTSTLANIVVDGVASAIRKSPAKKLYISNLMTKFGQTQDFKASDLVLEVNKYLGGNCLDFVLVNKNTKYSERMLTRYQTEKAEPIVDDLRDTQKLKVVRKDIVSSTPFIKDKNDKLVRSLIRHDSDKLARAIVALL